MNMCNIAARGLLTLGRRLSVCLFSLVATTTSNPVLEDILKISIDKFNADMIQVVSNSQPDKSILISAFSVMSPLAQLALASVGSTHDEILNTMTLPNDTIVKNVFANANQEIQSIKGVELTQANKIYVRDSVKLNNTFASATKKSFNSEVQKIHMGPETADKINKWVEDHTNKRIQHLIEPSSITSYTVAVLVNAIYFKGNWSKPFRKSDTDDAIFYITKEKTITVPMMYLISDLKYGWNEKLDAKFLKLDYEGEDMSLLVVLPNKIEGITDLLNKMKDLATLKDDYLNKPLITAKVEVFLPKFQIETTTNLKDTLKELGIITVFNSKEAQLNNLVIKHSEDERVYIETATQKTFIEVNEEGSEAAAATSMIANSLSSNGGNKPLRVFRADHPFLFFVMMKNNILFSGIYRG